MLRSIPKIHKKINIVIILILFLIGFSFLYFFYYRIRHQAVVYVSVSVIRQTGQLSTNNWLPYWIGNSLNIGDKEINPFGAEIVEIMDKAEYESGGSGTNIYLLLKVKATRDKSGIYLYKNKPLLIGSNIDLKLMKVGIGGSVIYVGETPPEYEEKKLKLIIYGKAVDGWIADNIRAGSQISDSHGNSLAKILSKKVTTPPSISTLARDETIKSYVMINEQGKKDMLLTIEVKVHKIGDKYYYEQTQKVKINEPLTLHFPEVSLGNMLITEILEQ